MGDAWTRLSDRLPPLGGLVVLATPGEPEGPAPDVALGWRGTDGWGTPAGDRLPFEPSHWIGLPPPPARSWPPVSRTGG